MKHSYIFLELRTDSVAKAKKFYGGLFGWKVKETSMGDEGLYSMLKVGVGKDFGTGIAENPARGKFPSHWTPYIAVENCSAFTKRAAKLGGKIVQQPKEYPWGTVSTVLDPSGAAFSIWQASR